MQLHTMQPPAEQGSGPYKSGAAILSTTASWPCQYGVFHSRCMDCCIRPASYGADVSSTSMPLRVALMGRGYCCLGGSVRVAN